MAVHVETAGSTQPGSGGHKAEREWLAPLIRREDVNALASDVMTELDLGVLEWRRPHPGAFRRAAVRHVIVAVSVTVFLMPWVGRGAAVLLPVTVLWALVVARKHVDHLAWAATDRAVAFRSGWLWRRTTIARVTKIQAVTRVESPFDRRVAMARVRVDTAGRGERSHPVDIPYLGVDTAVDLHRTLAKQAARTVFSIR